MTFATAYMDESYGHPGSDMLCVAGFRFEKENAVRLDGEWQEVLRREHMPYLHMADFTKDDIEPYSHLSRKQRVEIGKELISIINKYRSLAFISGVSESLFEKLWAEYYPPQYITGGGRLTPYAWCLNDCMKFVGTSALNDKPRGKIAFFFESGHQHQSQANNVISDMVTINPRVMKHLHYGSHSFIDKAESGALQAADMLAWLAGNYFKRGLPGGAEKMRKDFRALLEVEGPKPRSSLHWWTETRLRFYLAEMVDSRRTSFMAGVKRYLRDQS